MPAGSTSAVQTSIAGQVNLVNTDGLLLNFWDGNAGPKFNNAVNGGDGVWQNSIGNDNWTDAGGVVNAAYDDEANAHLAGTGGAVTIEERKRVGSGKRVTVRVDHGGRESLQHKTR